MSHQPKPAASTRTSRRLMTWLSSLGTFDHLMLAGIAGGIPYLTLKHLAGTPGTPAGVAGFVIGGLCVVVALVWRRWGRS